MACLVIDTFSNVAYLIYFGPIDLYEKTQEISFENVHLIYRVLKILEEKYLKFNFEAYGWVFMNKITKLMSEIIFRGWSFQTCICQKTKFQLHYFSTSFYTKFQF